MKKEEEVKATIDAEEPEEPTDETMPKPLVIPITPDVRYKAYEKTIDMYRNRWPQLLEEIRELDTDDLIQAWYGGFYICIHGNADNPEDNLKMDAIEEVMQERGITADEYCACDICVMEDGGA